MAQPWCAAVALLLRSIVLNHVVLYAAGQEEVPDIDSNPSTSDGGDLYPSPSDSNDGSLVSPTHRTRTNNHHRNVAISMEISHHGISHASLMMRRHPGEASALETGWSSTDTLKHQDPFFVERTDVGEAYQSDPSSAMPMGSRTSGEAPLREGSAMAIGKALAEEEARERTELDESGIDESESAVQISEKYGQTVRVQPADSRTELEPHSKMGASAPTVTSLGILSMLGNVLLTSPGSHQSYNMLADVTFHVDDDDDVLLPSTESLGQYVNSVADSASDAASLGVQQRSSMIWNSTLNNTLDHDCTHEEWVGEKRVTWCNCMKSGTLGGTKYLMADYMGCTKDGSAYDTDHEHSVQMHEAMRSDSQAACDLIALSAKCIHSVGCQGDKHQSKCKENQAKHNCDIDCGGTAAESNARYFLYPPSLTLAVVAVSELML